MNTSIEFAVAFRTIVGRDPTPDETAQMLAEAADLGTPGRGSRSGGVTRSTVRQRLERGRRRSRSLARRLQRAERDLAQWRHEAAAVRAELTGLRASATWRAALRAHDLIPPWLRRTAARILAWRRARHAPLPAPKGDEAPAGVVELETEPGRPRALVIENRWPQPDRDSGSIDVRNLVEALLAFGYDVIFAADMEHDLASADRDALAALGVRCLCAADTPSIRAFLEAEGGSLSLCVLSRVYGGGRFAEDVWQHCPDAQVVFNSIDLHYLRAERERSLGHDTAPIEDDVRQVRAREQFLVRECDATMVVSAAERAILEAQFPESLVVEMPLARPVSTRPARFAPRRGIGFIGGFAHAPNLDALRWFLADIWPLILRDHPDRVFTIVGSDLPDSMLADLPGSVRYLGHVPDVAPWFEDLRLTVAPIRFGAGAKGKIASSLAAGVPCVTTGVGAEGMHLRDREDVLVADAPEAFAACVREVYEDPVLWTRLSQGGQAHAATQLSIVGWRDRLHAMLWTMEALPEPAFAPAPSRVGSASEDGRGDR